MTKIIKAFLHKLSTSSPTEKISLRDKFLASISHRHPIIEEKADGTCSLTFIYQGGETTETVGLYSSICGSSIRELEKIEDTNLWYLTVNKVPSDARITYQYFDNNKPAPDPLNSFKIDTPYPLVGDQYIVELPQAKPQPHVQRERLSGVMETIKTDHRLLHEQINFRESQQLAGREVYMDNTQFSTEVLEADIADELQDESLRGTTKKDFRKNSNQGAIRNYWVHLPPNYDPHHQPPYKVLVHLDGKETMVSMKLPAIMDLAMEKGDIEPTISIYIDVGNRNIEYGCSEDARSYADFLATEFMPKLQHDYPSMSRLASNTTIAGFSMGGHAAVQIATQHPEVFGNVVGQSSSFWMGAQNSESGQFESEEGLLKKLQYQNFPDSTEFSPEQRNAAKKLCFYLNVGTLETEKYHSTSSGGLSIGEGGIGHDIANHHFAEFLKDKEIAYELETYTGDHCFAEWQELLVEGLIKTRQWQSAHAMVQEVESEKKPSATSLFKPTSTEISERHRPKVLLLTSNTDPEKIASIKASIQAVSPDVDVMLWYVNATDSTQETLEKINSEHCAAVILDKELAIHPWYIVNDYRNQSTEKQNPSLQFVIDGDPGSLTNSFFDAAGLMGNALVIKEGKQYIEAHRGHLDGGDVAESQAPNIETDTQHNMCSIGKMLTGLTVLKLTEKNPAILHNKLDQYLPEDFPHREKYREMTVAHLLTHTSGMGDYARKYHERLDDLSQSPPALQNISDFTPFIEEKPTEIEGNYCYSNLGFVVLGKVIEDVFNAEQPDLPPKNYWEIIEEIVLQPAGANIRRDLPSFYKTSASNAAFPITRLIASSPAGGNMWATTEDLAKVSTWISEQYKDPHFKALMQQLEPYAVKFKDGAFYAFGMTHRMVDGQVAYCHAGSAPGISSVLQVYPKDNSAIIVFLNSAKYRTSADFFGGMLESNVLKPHNIHYVNQDNPLSKIFLHEGASSTFNETPTTIIRN